MSPRDKSLRSDWLGSCHVTKSWTPIGCEDPGGGGAGAGTR